MLLEETKQEIEKLNQVVSTSDNNSKEKLKADIEMELKKC